MSKSHKDQRQHRRKVGGTDKGLAEHRKRDKRRGRKAKRAQKALAAVLVVAGGLGVAACAPATSTCTVPAGESPHARATVRVDNTGNSVTDLSSATVTMRFAGVVGDSLVITSWVVTRHWTPFQVQIAPGDAYTFSVREYPRHSVHRLPVKQCRVKMSGFIIMNGSGPSPGSSWQVSP
jgi:hypothetical protein